MNLGKKEMDSKQKRILFLGAGKSQVPAIRYAYDKGYYVITCDYLPDNPGHCYANEYHNVSTVDKEAVLELARSLKIDGIVSYATDANVLTEAYVREALGFPSNPYSAVETLVRKDLFRIFLKSHGFFTPRSAVFSNLVDLNSEINTFQFPVIIKPADSSGSNGISIISNIDTLVQAFQEAQQFSRANLVVVEEIFEIEGNISNGDGFIRNGKIIFGCWGDTNRNKILAPLVPMGNKFPTTLSAQKYQYASSEIQRLMTLLKMKQGPFNVEFGFDKNENFFIFDLGPRNGGHAVPRILKYATGVDLLKLTVDLALGIKHKVIKDAKVNGFFAEYKLHAKDDGVLNEVRYSDQIKENILEIFMSVKVGDNVKKMNRAADKIGVVYLKFNSNDEMQEKMENMQSYIEVIVKKSIDDMAKECT